MTLGGYPGPFKLKPEQCQACGKSYARVIAEDVVRCGCGTQPFAKVEAEILARRAKAG